MKFNLKAAVAVLTAFCMLISLFSVTFAASSDVKGHWAEKEITYFTDQGLANGYPDGTFKPNNFITRVEFIRLLNSVLDLEGRSDAKFSDVTGSSWIAEAISKAVAAGYITGYADGTIHPDGSLTRQEASVMIAKALKLVLNDTPSNFKDDAAIAEWGRGSINAAVAEGLIFGYPDHTFRPDRFLTRAEAVTILYRIKINIAKYTNALPAITSLNAANGTIGITLSTSASDLTSADYNVTAKLDNLDYSLQNLSYNTGSNSFNFTSIPLKSVQQTLFVNVAAAASSAKITSSASATVIINPFRSSGGGGGGNYTPPAAHTPIVSTYCFVPPTDDQVAHILTNEQSDFTLGLKAKQINDFGYSNVAVNAVVYSPEDATFQLFNVAPSGSAADIMLDSYWGPSTGFAISNNYNVTTTFKAVFSKTGRYTLILKLLDLNNASAEITSSTVNINVANVTPPTVTFTLPPTESGGFDMRSKLDSYKGIDKLDVVFAIDTTGSMGGEIGTVKSNSLAIMNQIRSDVADSNFGVVSFRDYPGFYSYPDTDASIASKDSGTLYHTLMSPSSPSKGNQSSRSTPSAVSSAVSSTFTESSYSGTYGDSTDRPYYLNKSVTDDVYAVKDALNLLYAGGGSDTPEAYTRVLYELGDLTDREDGVKWREDAKKVVILFGDAPTHDLTFAGYNYGGDPGRDGIAGTADDLKFVDVVKQLRSEGIIVLAVDGSGGYEDTEATFKGMSEGFAESPGTRGKYVLLKNSSEIPGIVDNLVAEESSIVRNLRVHVPDTFGSWVTVDPAVGYNDIDLKTIVGEPVYTFHIKITVPAGTLPGTYNFSLPVYADGALIDKTDVTVIVPGIPVTVSSIQELSDINVPTGTALGDVHLPSSVIVRLSDSTTASASSIAWDGGTPVYSSTASGTYVFTSTLSGLPFGVTNPENIKASINIIVSEPLKVISVQELSDITVPLGTLLEEIGLPTSINATLSNGKTISVNSITWDKGDPVYSTTTLGDYHFTATLGGLPAGVTNPDNVKDHIRVIVSEPIG